MQENSVKVWLEAMVRTQKSGWKGRKPPTPYLSIEDFVLQHGQEYQLAPYSINSSGKEANECFKNAYLAFIFNEKLRYVEGYARSAEIPLPMLHGWCIDENHKVLDPTWRDGVCYFGVVLDRDYVSLVLEARNKKCGVLECVEMRHPLLTGRHKYLGDGKVEYDR